MTPHSESSPSSAVQAASPDPVEQQAQFLLESGLRHESAGRLGSALQDYDAAIRLMPDFGRAHFCRGNVLLEQGQPEEALAAYATALRIKPDSAAAHYNSGNAYLRLGHHEQAKAAYLQALSLKPDFADAEAALGGLCEEGGEIEEALIHYRRALDLRPDYTEIHCNLGNTLSALGQFEEAAACFRQALALRPDYVAAHLGLGLALSALGRPDEAVACFRHVPESSPRHPEALLHLCETLHAINRREEALDCCWRALALLPDSAETHFRAGVLLQELGRLEDAAASYHRAAALNPSLAEAHSNLGTIHKELGQFDAEIASYRRALEIAPELAEAHSNLGNALRALGRHEEAIASYQKALEIKPDFAAAHYNLGVAFKEREQFDLAAASYRRALEIRPHFAEAWNNLGIALNRMGQLDEAMACYRRALAIEPDYAPAHMNLGSILKDLGRMEESLASTRRALEIDPEDTQAFSNLLFAHNYLCDRPPEVMLAEAKRYGEMVSRRAHTCTEWPNEPDPSRRLRVGLVSGDLCSHPVGFFLEGVLGALASLDDSSPELVAYPTRERDDPVSRRIRALCHAWHPATALSDESFSARVRQDRIDILFDLSGHTAHGRLPMFAWKPAPVQVSWLGYFATTGVREIDYLLADPWTLPPEEEHHFTEKIWRLPETRLCFTPPDLDMEPGRLPALDRGYVTFGSFNNLSKVNDEVIRLWARILAAVPGSRLFLKYRQLGELAMRQETLRRFAMHGIDPMRLIMEGHDSRRDYLAAYHRVDIGLDPFPFPGGTTTAEALWMGVPVLTLAGSYFLSRQGVGLLMNAGLKEWVAADTEDYVARAVAHAIDLRKLSALRQGLRAQVLASPVFDAERFARHFVAALRQMWRLWCESRH